MKQGYFWTKVVGAALCTLFAGAVVAQSVVQNTNEPRFPKGIPGLAEGQKNKPPSEAWLRDADTDTERFRRLEILLAGTEMAMWEIAVRFENMYDAILVNNYDYVRFNWDKIRARATSALMKRPKRTQNMELMLLDSNWKAIDEEFKTKDPVKVRAAFQTARQVCMGCHAAEKMPFFNDHPVFKKTENFPVNK
jgi:hypothetical protein